MLASTMNGQHILIVDDEPNVGDVLGIYLRRENFSVAIARDGKAALAEIERQPPDLLILDVMLPHVDGLQIVRRLREVESSDVPILILSAKTEESDRILGLEMGADDYVTKPFSPREVVTRVKAMLRRTKNTTIAVEKPATFGRLHIDPRTREVRLGGQSCNLTTKEFDLLWFLARHPRQVFTRDQLLEHVWGFAEYVDPSTVTVHVRRLREKIETDPSKPQFVQTVWGVGYRFESE
ncbi:MAG TPA: response regulator transcription factor [Anaerolineae bacterium]|nr:response regulator transcription factor [Anaerolineae bacterium]